MWTLLKDFFRFSKENKKLWMIPFFLLLLSVGMLVVLANSSAVAPFIYALF